MPEPAASLAEATESLLAPGSMFEIDVAEIRGIPTKVWKHAPTDLAAILRRSKDYGDRTFLVYEDDRYSFAEHYAEVATLAASLRARGVVPGDRVAIAMRNLPEWVMTFWATVCLGAISVPVNAWWSAEELQYAMEDSGAKVVVCDLERAERLAPVIASVDTLEHVVVVNEHRTGPADLGGFSDARFVGYEAFRGDVSPEAELPDAELSPDLDATMFYTSGTTGRPKGAVGTHRNALSNLMSLFFSGVRSGLRNPSTEPDGGPNAYLLTVPLFHATGCLAVMLTNTAAGGKLVMVHHFNPERALELIEREKITTFGGVPTIVMQVLDSPDFATRDTSSVRSVSYGGAPAPPELVRRIKAAFPLGQPGNGYGLTETSAATALNAGIDYLERPESCGPAVPTCEVAIVPEDFEGEEPDPNRPQGPTVVGELWIKGPNVVRGYWNRPEETAKTFTKGWLHSGDIARIDEDGFIYIVDRAKDVIIRGGENVYSVVVEAVLHEHPAVADCAVIGIPHPVLGEEVGAVVVLRPGVKVKAEELATFVGQHLASFSVPRHLYLREQPLPRNPQGKILKRELRDEVVGTQSSSS